MQYILYFLIAIGATTVGSLTGMGGGVIIKPLMDVMHHFDVETIGVLSSITVFSMSAVSIGKQMLAKVQIPFQIAIPLSLGSVVGGYIGQWMLSAIVSGVQAQGLVTVVQNGLLAVLILCVYLYMKHKANIRGLQLSGVLFSRDRRRPDQRSPYHLPILCQHENGHCLLSDDHSFCPDLQAGHGGPFYRVSGI